nr:A/G-specific adenine glycosylase [uncultured Aminipila sp.]
MRNNHQFQCDLLEWYHKNARVLPWRSEPTPYRVWISEMMLQQTRVDTVIPYFMNFICELPTVQALATVEEDKLLKLWQGLGYYNRALNLKKAAQILVAEHQGELPSEFTQLVSLPGIGPYSAGAIASIAFGKPVPAVDGNVLRIIARLLASHEDISNTKIRKQMQEIAAQLVSQEEPGNFNQALMDLGATICIPNGEPKCSQCPVSKHCKAYRHGLTSEIPIKVLKKVRSIDRKTVFVISSKEKFALRKREAGGLLPNLWEFPNVDVYLTEEQCKEVLTDMGIEVKQITELRPSKHIFSHREWHMNGFFIDAETDKSKLDFIWVTKNEINQKYAVPTAFKDFIKVCEKKATEM